MTVTENEHPESLADAILAGLDNEQRLVAQTLRGPLCVLAGAGTGKTRAITHRIAYGVAAGVYSPQRVLALTFTARAAAELRSRLRPLGAGAVSARTFHAAALAQLSFFWPQVIGGEPPRLLSGKGRLLAEAAAILKLRIDTASLRDLAAEIEWRKVTNLSFEEYEVAARSTRTMPGSLSVDQVIDLQREYEKVKDLRRQLDFEDILRVVSGMIQAEPSVALQIREQYRFFVVDEYQDVSPLQHHLLSLWLGDRRDLCVVGDASQTIYSFAGAQADYLVSFPREYPDATVVKLDRNYRSSAAIIGTANSLMRGRRGALTLVPARPESPQTSAPVHNSYLSDRHEAEAVAKEIALMISAGRPPEDIAVLYRMNAQTAPLETAFADEAVSYHIRDSQRFFDLAEVKQAVSLLRAASVSIRGEPLFKSVSDVLRSLGWSQHPPEGGGAVRARWESLNALMGLAEQMPQGATFREFTDELKHRQAGQHEPTLSAVTLATLHSAKGLEWPVVFVIGLSEGLLPVSYATSLEHIDEERRLLYVGITRSQEKLVLSWSRSRSGNAAERSPSRFLAELGNRIPDG